MESKNNQITSSPMDEEEDIHYLYAMQLSTATVLPMVLKAAIELGVLQVLEAASEQGSFLSPPQIASQLPIRNNPDASSVLDRMLRLLASYNIVTCSVEKATRDGLAIRLYGPAPVAKYFTRDRGGGSLFPLFNVVQGGVMMNMWYHLKDAVLEGGIPFDKAHGMNAVEYVGKDERFADVFKGSIRDFNPLLMESILATYDGFKGLNSLVDVGGGDGSILNTIISMYPNIKGINYDLLPVIQQSPSFAGIEHVPGDMFVSIPKGDAIFMKWILHTWDDNQFVKLLRNCHEALPGNGKVIAVDMVVPEIPGSSVADRSLLQFYVYMTSMNPRGKERTLAEFEALGKESGFSRVRVACVAYTFSVVEFLKSD